MSSMPKGLTAATGMDALTHAIEGYITAGAWELSDMFHLKAIEIISKSLRGAVENTPEGREGMALGQYIAGMGFSNVGLGIVHSMAHPLGALYDTPHGVANAIILPTVMEYNAPATGEKYRDIAKAMGVKGTDDMTQEEYRKAAVDAVRKLSQDVGIPANLKDIVKEEDIPFLAQSAYDDACRPGNPRETSVEEITAIAGVAKGSLYYHFSKKEDIFDMLLKEGFELLRNNIEIKTKNCTTALEKIKAVILIQIKVIVKYEYFLNVVFSQLWGEEEKNKKCKKAVFQYIKIIEKIVNEGIANGEFYDGDVEAIASGIFGVTCSSLIYRIKKNRKVDVIQVYNGFIDNVTRTLSKKWKILF